MTAEAVVDRRTRMDTLAQEIARVGEIVARLERQRIDGALVPNERTAHAVRLSRLKSEFTGLEAEMAELVAAHDEEEAAIRAAKEAEEQRQRDAANAELPKVTKVRLDALLAIEDATATLAAAVAAAIEADQQVARVNYVLGVREAPAQNRIAAYIHTGVRDAGVKMDDYYPGGRQALVDASERPQPGRPCTVCAHDQLKAIHQAVDAGEQSVAAIAGDSSSARTPYTDTSRTTGRAERWDVENAAFSLARGVERFPPPPAINRLPNRLRPRTLGDRGSAPMPRCGRALEAEGGARPLAAPGGGRGPAALAPRPQMTIVGWRVWVGFASSAGTASAGRADVYVMIA